MESKLLIFGIFLAFLTGFLVCYGMNSVYIDYEKPFFIGLLNHSEEPSDWLSEQNIEVFSDKVIIHVDNAVLTRYADTGSMLPTFGENANGIKIIPSSPEQINIGDIISYKYGDMTIVHRVVGKGEDENGIYFIAKGDNNPETDGKVYFKDIKYVTIGLIY